MIIHDHFYILNSHLFSIPGFFVIPEKHASRHRRQTNQQFNVSVFPYLPIFYFLTFFKSSSATTKFLTIKNNHVTFLNNRIAFLEDNSKSITCISTRCNCRLLKLQFPRACTQTLEAPSLQLH